MPSDEDRTGSALGWGALVALPLALPLALLCCAGPVLIGALGAGVLAAWWAHGYGYAALASLAAAVAGVWLWRRKTGSQRGCGDRA